MPRASNSGATSGGMLASQEHLDDLRLFHGGGQLALEDLLAGIEDNDAVGDVLDEAHEMLNHDNRNAACGKRLDAAGDPVELGRVEAGREFVEQEQPRTGGEC